jgi:PilZ domain-containing protein
MTHVPAATPRSLLIHDGELADVRELLAALAVPFVERIGPECDEDRRCPWDLVIASAKRILELHLPSASAPPTQIAILSHDARTLRSSLRRTGTTLMVRRPVHPAALRALVLHALYRGPEKRRSTRVNIGAPVRVKVGWRQRSALLVDLSVTGCRLITDRATAPGDAFRLLMPAELAGGKALALEARVVACSLSRDPAVGRFVTMAAFESLNARTHAHLHAAVAAHAEGPALWQGGAAVITPLDSAPPISEAPHVDSPPAESVACETELELDELECDFDALLEDEGARVLMGRDLSRSGMRVDPNPLLAVGMKLQLAVHAETREMPLVLQAVVERDDGERGFVLRFCDLSAELSRYLDYVIHALPLVIDDDDDEGCLITELLEAS